MRLVQMGGSGFQVARGRGVGYGEWTFIHNLGAAMKKTVESPRRRALAEVESMAVLSRYGIPLVESIVAGDVEAAVAAARELGFPVVLKGHGEGLAHLTHDLSVRWDRGVALREQATHRWQKRRCGPIQGAVEIKDEKACLVHETDVTGLRTSLQSAPSHFAGCL